MDTQLSPQTPDTTMSGHPLQPVYGPDDAAAPDAPPPGTYPYTRGLHP
jgi:methylmalonyl-CoA mutase, N-terminal domain